MERLNEKMGQLKAEFISRDGLRFNERKKNMNALVTIQRFVIVMSSKISLNCKIYNIQFVKINNQHSLLCEIF